jgi:hypothetical protein
MKNIKILALAIALSACAYNPVIDPRSCQGCDYERDYNECNALAKQNSNVAVGAITGAGVSAGVGAIIGAFTGLDVGQMAAMGASLGALQGAGNEMGNNNQMVARCLQSRGYSVLR